ncbi:MAG: hypothetical protein R3223_13415 [Longimicrobiales bacterium]|nr:hypothetical protein [Longimicrobiales bacterium]
MRRTPVTSLTGLLLIVQPFSSTGSAASAQEPSDATPACTVQVAARTLDAGLSAVRVWAYLSRDIGRVHTLHVSDESGIVLASPDLLQRIRVAESVERARERDEIAPIAMGPEPRSARLWLNLFQAEPGEHEIVLVGDRGRCSGTLRVE